MLGLDTLVYELILRVAQPGEGAWIGALFTFESIDFMV